MVAGSGAQIGLAGSVGQIVASRFWAACSWRCDADRLRLALFSCLLRLACALAAWLRLFFSVDT